MPLAMTQETDAAFAVTVAKGDKQFLKRVQLLQPLSDAVVKGEPVGCRPGEYLIGMKDKAARLTNQMVVLVGRYRFHAIVIQDKKVEAESFDQNDPVYVSIEREVLSKVKKPNRAVKFGIDFLLYIVELNQFGVYFFAGTAKQEAPEALKRQGKLALFSSRLVESGSNKWYVPIVIDAPEGTPQPVIDQLVLQTTLTTFAVDKTAAEPEESAETARPR